MGFFGNGQTSKAEVEFESTADGKSIQRKLYSG